MRNEKVIHVTHNDADGVGCGIVAAIMLGNTYDLEHNTHFCSIGGVNEKLNSLLDEYDENDNIPDLVIISDISISEDTADRLEEYEKKGTKLIGVDHHGTNTLRRPWFKVITDKFKDVRFKEPVLISATYILSFVLKEVLSINEDMYLISDNRVMNNFKLMIDMISRYDTWEWKYKPFDYNGLLDYKENIYSVITSFIGPDKTFEDLFLHYKSYYIVDIAEDDYITPFPAMFKIIYNIECQNSERFIKSLKDKTRVYEEDGKVIATFINENEYSNDAAEFLYGYNFIDIVEILYPSSSITGYRTKKDDIDVSKFALTRYDGKGGGHAKASGTNSISDEKYAMIMNRFFSSPKLKDYITDNNLICDEA